MEGCSNFRGLCLEIKICPSTISKSPSIREKDISLKIDSNLIGGVVVKSGDLIYDGSVKSQLEKIEDRLKEGVV